jgi:Domain of unknown function (DUF4160)
MCSADSCLLFLYAALHTQLCAQRHRQAPLRVCRQTAGQRQRCPSKRRSDPDPTASDRPPSRPAAIPRAGCLMPRISEFYGIVVTMYSSDHAPPHFHARYGEYGAQIVIDTGAPLAGQLPIRALRFIREWVELHRAELRDDWERAQARTPLASIDPLP